MHDLYVVSDLHMGRGLNPATRRFHRLETFFYEADLRSFVRWACAEAKTRGRKFKLVLNGDVFDLLRIELEDVPLSHGSLAPGAAARLVGEILAGHPQFVDGIAEVILEGHEVVQLPGNHDREVQWTQVQDVIRSAVVKRVVERGGADRADTAGARLTFAPWFFYEAGRVWIEHGCQYDPENAYRFPLRSALPDSEAGMREAELDMPLGNFVQRYLYNHFGSITFIVPNAKAHVRYFKWLLLNSPATLLRVTLRHVPFGFRVVRRLAKAATTMKGEISRIHDRELETLAASSGLAGRLLAIDALKVPGADAVNAVRALSSQLLKSTAILAGLGFAFIFARTGGYAVADAVSAGVGAETVLTVALDLILLALLAGGILWAVLRVPRDHAPRPLRRAAQSIARLLDVPIVSFGHTHDEFVAPLERTSGRAWYYNTGTWIAVFTHDVLLPRERVQFTFLRVRDTEAELLHWSPGRNGALPVVLIEERVGDPAAAPG